MKHIHLGSEIWFEEKYDPVGPLYDFIFDRWYCSGAAATPVKYQFDILQVVCILMIKKNNEMEEIGLVTRTPKSWYKHPWKKWRL